MNKKSIIQITVAVVAFIATGLVMYFGYFNKKANDLAAFRAFQSIAQSSTNSSALKSANKDSKILPYGAFLDISGVLKRQNLDFKPAEYPKLDPKADVGIDAENLVKSLNAQ